MPGLRQIILILGVIFLFRLIGKIMTARRQVNEHKANQRQDMAQKHDQANVGKTTISKVDKKAIKNEDYTPFEEVD